MSVTTRFTVQQGPGFALMQSIMTKESMEAILKLNGCPMKIESEEQFEFFKSKIMEGYNLATRDAERAVNAGIKKSVTRPLSNRGQPPQRLADLNVKRDLYPMNFSFNE